MAEKSDQELLAMLETPADWTPEALDAAKAELKTRDTDTKASPLHQTPPVQKSKEAVPITVTTQFLAWRAMLVSTIWAPFFLVWIVADNPQIWIRQIPVVVWAFDGIFVVGSLFCTIANYQTLVFLYLAGCVEFSRTYALKYLILSLVLLISALGFWTNPQDYAGYCVVLSGAYLLVLWIVGHDIKSKKL